MIRKALLMGLAAALSACSGGDTSSASSTPATPSTPAPATAQPPPAEPVDADAPRPDPSQLKLKKSKAKAVARVIVTGDAKGRDGTFTVRGRNVAFGGCLQRDVSDVASLQFGPLELFGLAENPKLEKDEDVVSSVQVVTLLPEGNGTLTDVPVLFSARYSGEEARNDDFITFTTMAGTSALGEGSATVERKGRRVNVTIRGQDPQAGQVRAAFSCRLPKS